jgi:hypothetical protein
MEEITIYKFQLKTIAEALRVAINALESQKQETCLDRQLVQANQYAKNALNGEKDKSVKYGSRLS